MPAPTTSAPTTSGPPLRVWLDSVSALISERRSNPQDLAHDLVAQDAFVSPRGNALRQAGRVAETARTDLSLACAVVHHSQAALLLGEAGAGQLVNGTLLWGLTGRGLHAHRRSPVALDGRATTCCKPPTSDVLYVVVDRECGHLLTVDTDGDQPAGALATAAPASGTATVLELRRARAVVRGSISTHSVAHTLTYGRLLEAAAWYGALTRLADGMLSAFAASDADEEAGGDALGGSRAAMTHLAETDAMLSAIWGSIRDGIAVWERGLSSLRTARHHVARARTLTRLAASSVLFGYVPLEDEAARRTGVTPEVRENLVAWMARSDLDTDSTVVAEAVLRDGPSW